MAQRETLSDKFLRLLVTNIGTKLISLVIAVLLWGIVLGSRNVEVTKDYPLQLITPPELIPVNDIPDRVTFRLSGPKAFLRTVLDQKEDPIQVNLSTAKAGLITYRFFSDNIRLPIGVKVLSINPGAILVKLEPLKRKDVPVRLLIQGSPPDHYRLTKSEVKPAVVRIKGAETKVDNVTEVMTQLVDVSNLKRDLEREVALDLKKLGVQIDGPLPRVVISVEPVSANYRIKNVDIRVLSPYKANLEEKTVTVLVRAEEKDLKYLDRNYVYAVIDLSSKPKGRYFVPVQVSLPENVGLVKVIPQRVKVTLD